MSGGGRPGMGRRRSRLMDAPSIHNMYGRCVICGRPAGGRHHIVPKGMGGRREEGPTALVCGDGNLCGCHGELHAHTLHLDWRGGRWMWLRTDSPTSDDDLPREGWREVRKDGGNVYVHGRGGTR